MQKQNTISAHLIQFCRFLRLHDYNLGPLEQQSALQALSISPFSKPEYFKNVLRSTLVKNKRQLDQFDALYLQYWSEVKKAENSKIKEKPETKEQPEKPKKAPAIHTIKKWLYGAKEEEEIEMASYSEEDVFTKQNFSNYSKEELSEALLYTNRLARKLSNKKGQRYISSKRKNSLDFRKLMRRNIGRSDEMIHLSFKKRKIEKLRLVLICDVSRSMELYTKFLLQFMYGLNQASTRIETFVFSTKLERITKSLHSKDFGMALQDVQESFDQWSGGTRIGHSLMEFVDHYGDIYLSQKTKVIILSDGWDTGSPELVQESMSQIKRKCAKVIWLNPLAANPNFTPDVACLKAAWPYIDVFQAANSIENLRKLIQKL